MSFPVTALLIGVWSVGHCLAMCGGLAMAAGQNSRQNLNNSLSARAAELFSWQLGRVLSYTFFGMIAGGFGAFFLAAAPFAFVQKAAFIAANLLLIALGLHVAQLYSGITQIERIGAVFWKWISPLASATLLPQTRTPRNRPKEIIRALRAGAIWGWLPCGLVYSMLVTASVSGSATNGALWMLAFGLGTLPALWITSLASVGSAQVMKKLWVRRTAGIIIMAFGLWGILRITGLASYAGLDAFCIGAHVL